MFFFSAICSKVIDPLKLDDLENEVFVSELGEGGYNNVLCDEDQVKELHSTSLVDCGLKS